MDMKEAEIFEALGLEQPSQSASLTAPPDAPAGVSGRATEASEKPSQSPLATAPPEGEPRGLCEPRHLASREGEPRGLCEPRRLASREGEPRGLSEPGEPGETAGPEDGEGQSGAGTRENPPDAGEEGDAGTAETSEKTPQTEEQRARNAARRRRAEQQEAIDRAVEEALRKEREKAEGEWKTFFAQAHLKNSVTGAEITSRQEFRDWQDAYAAAQLERELKAGKLTPEGLNAAISRHPAVQRAEAMLQRTEEEEKAARAAADQAAIAEELRQLHELDPSINGMTDLLKMPKAKEFYEYVRRGNTFVDAWYLTHREELEQRTAEAARVQAGRNARGKEHLRPAGSTRGPGTESVPKDEMVIFRSLMPDATEDEITSYYNKDRKRKEL